MGSKRGRQASGVISGVAQRAGAHERARCADTEKSVSTGSGSSPEGRDDESPALREAAPSDAVRRR